MMKSSLVTTNADSMSVACLEPIVDAWKKNMEIYVKVPKALSFYIFPSGLQEYQNFLVVLYPRYCRILFYFLFSFQQFDSTLF